MSRPFAFLHAAAVALAVTLPSAAQPREDIEALAEALALPGLLEIMRAEGVAYGRELQEGLLQGRGGSAWAASVEAVYDPARMAETVRGHLARDLDPGEVEPVIGFFATPQGQEIVAAELAARRALLDEAAEAAASEAWMRLEAAGGPRWDLLVAFAEVNDLVESNVAGAMTSSYAFYSGLAEGGALGRDLSEDQILSDVWSRELEIREDTVDWVYSFTTLAYEPLSDETLRAYVDFAGTEAGRAMNAALFTAFNDMFTEISRALGRGAARVLAGQDI